MQKVRSTLFMIAFVLGMPLASVSAEMEHDVSPIKKMSKEELIKLAMSAAPSSISKDATILIPREDGSLEEAKKGTNGFICIPDIDGLKDPDPICADPASWQWLNDLISGTPEPTNTVPGISYMAKGGWHFEKDGKILMKNEPGAKAIKEPPHWMVFWPFEQKTVGLPTFPDNFGVYIMWEGTPYAHLMVYQDPTKMKK